jgi:hypothetical protein
MTINTNLIFRQKKIHAMSPLLCGVFAIVASVTAVPTQQVCTLPFFASVFPHPTPRVPLWAPTRPHGGWCRMIVSGLQSCSAAHPLRILLHVVDLMSPTCNVRQGTASPVKERWLRVDYLAIFFFWKREIHCLRACPRPPPPLMMMCPRSIDLCFARCQFTNSA